MNWSSEAGTGNTTVLLTADYETLYEYTYFSPTGLSDFPPIILYAYGYVVVGLMRNGYYYFNHKLLWPASEPQRPIFGTPEIETFIQ